MTSSEKPRISIHSPKWTEAAQTSLEAIVARAKAVSTDRSRRLFDDEGNALDPAWKAVLAELDTWAATHNVALGTSEYERRLIGGTDAVTTATCPSVMTSTETVTFEGLNQKYKVKHTCVLRRQTLLGRCVYNCTSEML